MIKSIQSRWNSEETKIGKFLKNWVGKLLLFCSALGAANEYIAVLPPDFVPVWVKASVIGAGFISFVAGKMTKK